MKSVTKHIVVKRVIAGMKGIRRAIQARPSYIDIFELAAWRKAQTHIRSYQASDMPRRICIIPSDPWALQGAKGDEAMMHAAIQAVRAFSPDVEVGVITATEAAAALAERRGYRPLNAWKAPFSYADLVPAFSDFRPDITLLIGADVVDGYYSPAFSTRLLLAADLSARLGSKVSVMGFSFNATPAPGLAKVFELLHESVRLNLRDKVSFDRFVAFTGVTPNFSADVAFLLKPEVGTEAVGELTDWIAGRKQAGKQVVGFNIHPMLFRDATPAQIQATISVSTAALRKVYSQRDVAFLLVSHDSREHHGDDICLLPILEQLRDGLGSDIRFSPTTLSAAEIKAVAGELDGVVTARMHLAIASLGQGVPVAAVTYQDKFQGLFDHFGVSQNYTLAPADFMMDGKLEAMMVQFIDNLVPLRTLVNEKLPDVLDKAARNFDGVLPAR